MNNEMDKICNLLSESKTIAVVGISRDPDKTSRQIAQALVDKGYMVVGVNPSFNDANGIKVYPRITDIPHDIDIINVFRKPEDIPEIIDDVVTKKPKALWLQQGIRNDEAVKPVEERDIFVIQDKCIAVFYSLCKAHRKE